MKFLLTAVVLVVVYLLWRHQRAQERAEEHRPERPADPARALAPPQDMVRCPVCAVHLPRAEAVADARGQLFCSAEHRRIGGAA